MSCTAPTFSWACRCPALPLPTYPLVIFFKKKKKHYFFLFFSILFSYSSSGQSRDSVFLGPSHGPSALSLKYPLSPHHQAVVGNIRYPLYLFLPKEKLQLSSHSQLPCHPSQPSACPPPGLLGARAQQNLFRHMDKNPSATSHTQSAIVPGLPALPGSPEAITVQ